MKKENKKFIVMDYITIIVAFITFIVSLIVYNMFNYRTKADFYLGMMAITAIIIAIGFKNLKADRKSI